MARSATSRESKDRPLTPTGQRLSIGRMDFPIQFRRVMRRWRAILWCLASCSTPAFAGDWPQYRGPNHDGSSSEKLRTDWGSTPPKVLWKKSVGPAWSSISTGGGKLFTQVQRFVSNRDTELCVALDAKTGQELWATPLDDADYPDGGTGPTDGPRSTPSVDGDSVYVFTSYLKLYCLQASTGKVVWMRDFPGEFPGTTVINWQNAASPLIVGDLIYLNSNVQNKRLMALRKSDGATVWATQDDRMTHATPVYATLADRQQVLFLTAQGLVGVTPDTGSILWRYTFTPSGTSTAASPIASGEYVYASCAYALGAWSARVTGSAAGLTATQTDFKRGSAYQNHWATPVAHEGYLYGIVENGQRSLACFSLAGRTNRWITTSVGGQNPGYGSLIKVGGKLLVLTESGRLVLLEPNPEKYTEIARFDALAGTSWNHPIFSNGRIYARSATQMVALDVSVPEIALPDLLLDAQWLADSGRLRVEIRAVNGTPLDVTAIPRVVLQSNAALENAAGWTAVQGSLTAEAGRLVWSQPALPGAPHQFLRVQVRPTSP